MLFDNIELDDEVKEMVYHLDACAYIKWMINFEHLDRPTRPPPKLSIKEAPKLELKPLPSHLHYAYLGANETLLVVVSFKLSIFQEEKLFCVPLEYKHAIGRTMTNIRGISPMFCMHKILMEDGHKPSVEHQRRLNPVMKEEVRKEVIKWIDASIIFPIFDNCIKSGFCLFLSRFGQFLESFEGGLASSIARPSFDKCLKNLSKVFVRCEETNLVLNWEKCYFWFLEKDTPFKFDDHYLKAYEELKNRLVTAPIITAWTGGPFELMCDAIGTTIEVVLVQRKNKVFHSIYNANKTLNPTPINYTVTDKELLAVVWAFDKFRAYLVGTKVIVYIKPCNHQVVDHLPRLETRAYVDEDGEIQKRFPDERLLVVTAGAAPWHADYVNFIVSGVTSSELSPDGKRNFMNNVRLYLWDEPFLFKHCADQLVHHCAPEEMEDILHDCHASPYERHHGGYKRLQRCCKKMVQPKPNAPLMEKGKGKAIAPTKEKVDEEPEFDVIIPAPLRGTDITSIRAKEENDMTMLTGFEHNARDDSFMVM
ncbi:uncharacterized protein LOC142180747 [Nicotiana tabacum]|uniref:Uncharacterized protein LOC142180747 n=1 Tax=Nicotiana tabacum TaxID=4097 RepID=A0AC58UHG3_TOBAC